VADAIYFVESGSIIVFTTFEGNEFILDTLQAGSIINQKAFFLKDVMYVNMRAKTQVKLLKYSQ